MPYLPGGVGVFAEDGESFADVRDVGVAVRLVGVTEDGRGLAGCRGGKDPIAGGGLGAALRAEVVRGAADRDLDAPGLGCGEEVAGHPGPQPPFGGVGGVGTVLGERSAVGAAVHVDVLHADQAGAGGLSRGEYAGLQWGPLRRPLVVWRVEGLVEHGGALGDGAGEGGVT